MGNREKVTTMKVIAHICTDFPEKFGIPRQSGLIDSLKGKIVFENEYRNPEAVKGLEGFNYIWLLWQFQGTDRDGWSATVKPPRLGGKKRMGVFATRSPFRPNPIGLSSVKLERIEYTDQGPVLWVAGIDLKDGTPIYDIKPYLPFADCHPDAKEGFADYAKDIAMQIAAANPQYLDRASVPADIIEKEKEILTAQAINEGKPANIAEKMVMGRINKYYKENCLVEQEFVKDNELTITKYSDKIAKELGGKIAIVGFARFEKGEGLEKRNDNFADEVASMVK